MSYTGYTTTTMKIRFSNNKSHFKDENPSCLLISHLLDCDHDVDFSSRKSYDVSLSRHLRVTLLEKVDVSDCRNQSQREAKCEKREGYWQNQLKTLVTYGGLNKRDNRKYVARKTRETGS